MIFEEKFSVAPMMEWTDRHCRYFHRLLSGSAVLYTEMISADALIFGPRHKLLAFNNEELPCVLQLGGNDPKKLSLAVFQFVSRVTLWCLTKTIFSKW